MAEMFADLVGTDAGMDGSSALSQHGGTSGLDTDISSTDFNAGRAYLAALLPLVMGASRSDLERTLFQAEDFRPMLAKFATDAALNVCWVLQERSAVEQSREGTLPGGDHDDGEDHPPSFSYSLHLPPLPPHSSNTLTTLSLIKSSPALDLSRPLGGQLHFVVLSAAATGNTTGEINPDETSQMTHSKSGHNGGATSHAQVSTATPYEGLHSIVHYGVTPWFESYVASHTNARSNLGDGGRGLSGAAVGSKKGSAAEQQMGIPVALTKRKFAELELSLLHLQQNVEIPEPVLVIQSAIQAAVDSCRAKGSRVSVDAIQPASLLMDTPFLNRLQADVNLWIRSIQAVTKLNRDVASGTASQEISFWLSKERALEAIDAQLNGPAVQLVLDTLKAAKRYHATTSFLADTGLRESQDQSARYNALMRDFPLNELLSATDFDKIRESLFLIFAHINKKLRVSPYPLRRTLPLVEAISSDFNDQCLKVLAGHRIMHMDHATFGRTLHAVMDAFAAWEENIKDFTNVAREVMRKRSEKFIPIKVNPGHIKTQERLTYLMAFRKSHEQLQAMTGPGGKLRTVPGEASTAGEMENEVRLAYEIIKSVDVLDTSAEGTEVLVLAENAYNERVARVENRIIAALRDKLASARNAHEMFKAFSNFNSLFVRPKIRGAVQEYQTRLIDSVKSDIKVLHRKFTNNYRNSEAYRMSQLRDMPPVASAIIWAKQIERQLVLSMRRVEDVLGSGWELYAEGEKLKLESDAFRSKLDVRPIYDAWVQDVTRAEPKVGGRLLEIQRQRGIAPLVDGSFPLELAVNFDPGAIVLFKEVRNLLWFNFPVPHAIITYAKEAKRVYPFAVSLIEAVRIYNQTCRIIDQSDSITSLVAGYRLDVQDLIQQGLQLQWEDISFSFSSARYSATGAGDQREDPAIAFFREFAQSASILQEKTTSLMHVQTAIEEDFRSLQTCRYGFDSFSATLSRVQAKIDELNLDNFANLDVWVAELDQRVASILKGRCKLVLESWAHQLRDDPSVDSTGREESPLSQVRERIQMTTVVHELRMRNQVIYVDPPLEMTHSLWLKQCRRILACASSQTRLRSSSYDLTTNLKDGSPQGPTYNELLFADNRHPLHEAVMIAQDKVATIQAYVEKWMQFQTLWDLNPDLVYERLGDDLEQWASLLQEIRQTRTTFDTVVSRKSFGVCLVDYAAIQGKVNAKYDAWQRDILSRYGQKLGTSMGVIHAAIGKGRRELERRNVNAGTTADAVDFITFVEDLKKRRSHWAPMIQSFQDGQRTLERQRYAFTDDWLHADQVIGEWTAFNEILARKDDTIQTQLSGLRVKILAEDAIVGEKINSLAEDWSRDKPIQGSVKAKVAVESIATYEVRIDRLHKDQGQLWRAKDALQMSYLKDDRLNMILGEARDLKAVWMALSVIWEQLQQLRETSWTAIQPRKLRQSLDSMASALRDLPSRMRQYAAYEYAQDRLRELGRINGLISELRSESMRERHWQQIYRSLRVGQIYRPSNFSLGAVYDLDLKRNEKLLKEVVTQAQGEIALEEFLRQVRTTWEGYSLELTTYQNKCRIVKGWDELFNKCREHLSSLSAMQASPYYRVFQEEAAGFEDKLNKTHVLFDIWIDVQRQWVYLEGIFADNADIKQLLPVESSRFSNINAEFMTVLKGVYRSPLVFDVIALPNVQKTFEKLAGALAKIQKALGDYLERERIAFPRFYFLGDEDLLEIIGNAKDIGRVAKHLKKMFAGIASITLSVDGGCIQSMVSGDGEVVSLRPTVDLRHAPKINEWLSKLEASMKVSLAAELEDACSSVREFFAPDIAFDSNLYQLWIEKRPVQAILLAVQVAWTELIEKRFRAGQSLRAVQTIITTALEHLAALVLTDIEASVRRKCEHLITAYVHQRDALRALIGRDVSSCEEFGWQQQMRYYLDTSAINKDSTLTVQMADATFSYGFEYLGAPEPLVQTALTDRCYLTLTQALRNQLGGSPFGPAGTGKTESVKALGNKLGRYVLVFCCDEGFDFQAMGRILVGISRVGAWGCFDEFNRLEERILSAVSQQIQTIQQGLAKSRDRDIVGVQLLGKQVPLHPETGIFITMNPGYAGRSNLPENLKKLFRGVSMTRPDQEVIAQVMLYSQGFSHAETLASKIVPLFQLCNEQLSKQPHYDFGLRALKSVLIRAGMLQRDFSAGTGTPPADKSSEQGILVRSILETVGPKLHTSDSDLLNKLVSDLFPGVSAPSLDMEALLGTVKQVCNERHLAPESAWLEKVVQLYQILRVNHGVMLVGSEASGKTKTWTVLLESLRRLEQMEAVSYVIDPKALDKDRLYGHLDTTTREWTDGLVTHILRRIIEDARGEGNKRHWIVFDGDVDPEWVENLNSVLDDNKTLTLPNGERLAVPPNVRFLFEVDGLRCATLATVSRCGIIYFHESVVTREMMVYSHLRHLLSGDFTLEEDRTDGRRNRPDQSPGRAICLPETVHGILLPFFASDGLVPKAIDLARSMTHVMPFSVARALLTLFSQIKRICGDISLYNSQHADFPLSSSAVTRYVERNLLLSIVWALTGDADNVNRARMGDFIVLESNVEPPSLGGNALLDFDVDIVSGDWLAWSSRVPEMNLETHQVNAADVVIPTTDTLRQEDVLYSWIQQRRPLILCGPPGSGKTMILTNAIRKLPDIQLSGLNFSSATSPELVLKNFEQYCDYRKTPTGVVLAPKQPGKWLVVFCDEINLPAPDKYGTQRVISFLRQMVETGGFWRASDLSWIKLERIQFVGACNPPTDPGRTPMSERFLRHAPLLLVGYPSPDSLAQIYSAFARAALKVVPNLRSHAQALTEAMISLFEASRQRFTAEEQAHYIYSPRELSRWIRGIYEAIRPLEALDAEGLVRIWAHEGQRLFQDRLVSEIDRNWTETTIDTIATEHFPGIDHARALAKPILFSNWMTKDYLPVDRDSLRDFTRARLRTFYEEELDVPLVLFDEFLDHVLRIDRVFRQPQGHVLLIGVSGSGKTTMSRFVAWMNGLSVFQIKVSARYTALDFDEDLKQVLKRAGCKGEKICFILDEANILESSLLERMNTLLANSEVPGLFEGDEYTALMTACREGSQRDGQMLDSHDELYRWFSNQIGRNLHIVFTMNPPTSGLGNKTATSPALFNRCVLDWFGDWSTVSLEQVAEELTSALDLENASFEQQQKADLTSDGNSTPSHRSAITKTMVEVHNTVKRMVTRATLAAHSSALSVTPRHFLEFLQQYILIFAEKRDDFEEQQRHLNAGLEKLGETVAEVEIMRRDLAAKDRILSAKEAEGKAKLKQLLQDQQTAEAKRREALEVKAQIATRNEDIGRKKADAESQLASAEPAVRSAAEAVGGIKKQQLAEVKSMRNPPEAIKLALEATCVMLGTLPRGSLGGDTWAIVRSVVSGDGFISTILNFQANDIRPEVRHLLTREYLVNPNFTTDAVYKANRACAPLVNWVRAQLAYANILELVGPLRMQIMELEDKATGLRELSMHLEAALEETESNIGRYTVEYASLISETEAIKADKRRVEDKVTRSTSLLAGLSSEESRWARQNALFATEILTIPGDVLVGAAFQAYAGYFDQAQREQLLQEWSHLLSVAHLRHRADLSLVEYLSTPDQRARWIQDGLPEDSLCIENAMMLARFVRYPFIIDPSHQADAFLQNTYKGRKMIVTSFLDSAFTKNLESALRFGTPLYVRDVERIDPVLNSVLNREIRRTGGRQLIRLGTQDIDFSPAFTIFLSTRDTDIRLGADVSSRVTLVNFSLTPASLESQSLTRVLKAERPDTEARRKDLHKLQGEFRLRLRQLEQALLQALSTTSGHILEDDRLLATLESLKMESASVAQKMDDTETVMSEIELVTADYTPIARACSMLYSALGSLAQLDHFYQYSLRYFNGCFEQALLRNPDLRGVREHKDRAAIILKSLIIETYRRTATTVRQQDRAVAAGLFGQVYLTVTGDSASAEGLRDSLSQSLVREGNVQALDTVGWLTAEQRHSLGSLPGEDARAIIESLRLESEAWQEAYHAERPVQSVCKRLPEQTAIAAFAVISRLRPDRVENAVFDLVSSSLAVNLNESSPTDLADIVHAESDCSTPIVLCSLPGHDASFRVDALVKISKVSCEQIAMGSEECFSLADQAILVAARQGTWVVLKNTHLVTGWLDQLHKRVRGMNAHAGFRLFLTMEMQTNIPTALLQNARVIMTEPAPGLRAAVLEALDTPISVMTDKWPMEGNRLFFLLSWLHAILQERRRFVPLGWTKAYDFNESDLTAGIMTINHWLISAARGRSNLDPQSIPWMAIKLIIKQAVYGGRIDVDHDQRVLDAFVNKIFRAEAYDNNFALVQTQGDEASVLLPEATSLAQFVDFALSLPKHTPCTWLGLPAHSEEALARAKGLDLLSRLRKLQDPGLASLHEEDGSSPARLTKLLSKTKLSELGQWLDQILPIDHALPASLPFPAESPLSRFWHREFATAESLLKTVRSDLRSVSEHCTGATMLTNAVRGLAEELNKGDIPKAWRQYKDASTLSVSGWIVDFSSRLSHMREATKVRDGTSSTSGPHAIRLDRILNPEAWLTATQQTTAHTDKVALEKLRLVLDFGGDERQDEDVRGGFPIEGLLVQGGQVNEGSLSLNNGASTPILQSRVRWTVDPRVQQGSMMTLPMFLNGERRCQLFDVELPLVSGLSEGSVLESGCVFLAGP